MSEKSKSEILREELFLKLKNGRLISSDEILEKADTYSVGYKEFLNLAKTEREAVKTAVLMAEKAGFTEFCRGKQYKAGDRVYIAQHGVLYVTLRSAFKLDARLEEKIRVAAEKMVEGAGGKISFRVIIEPELIGGLLLRVGDKIFDGTINNILYSIDICHIVKVPAIPEPVKSIFFKAGFIFCHGFPAHIPVLQIAHSEHSRYCNSNAYYCYILRDLLENKK